MIVDSNIIIYSIQPTYSALRQYLRAHETSVHVSLISKLETLGYHKITSEERQKLSVFFENVLALPVSTIIMEEAIRLRQQRKRSLGDSIIAATALLYDLPLLTNNVGDFSDIPGLQTIPLQSVI